MLVAQSFNKGKKMNVKLEDLDMKEFELATGLSKELKRNGADEYIDWLTTRVAHIAEAVSLLTPNERIVFEDVLKRFKEVHSDS